jgi:hypothetical protein
MTEIEMWLVAGLVVPVVGLCILNLQLQRKLTRAESYIRCIKWDLESALEQLGPLSEDDAGALELIQQYAADDSAGQLFP